MTDGPSNSAPEPSLREINEIMGGYVPARCLAVAVQLGLFTCIAEGAASAAEIARKSNCSLRGTTALLDPLCALGLLRKEGVAYRLSSGAREYLVRSSPNYMGAMMEGDRLWDSWTRLPESVRSGKPLEKLESKAAAEVFFPQLVRSLHINNARPAAMCAQGLLETSPRRGLRVLDVACGSGIWGISTAEADRQAMVTFHDFPGLLDLTRTYVERHKLTDRADYLGGDLRSTDFGDSRFDVAILGNIVHSEGPRHSQELFKKLHRALAPEGRIVVIDMIPNEERTGPLMPLTFALTMLLNTEQGGTYTLGEYTEWLEAAGFTKVTSLPIESHSPMIVATRA